MIAEETLYLLVSLVLFPDGLLGVVGGITQHPVEFSQHLAQVVGGVAGHTLHMFRLKERNTLC